MSILYIIGLILLDMSLVLIMFRLYGKNGLLLMYILNIFISQITINVTYDILDLNIVIGSCFYAVIYLIVDMINEHYGKVEANSIVNIGVFSLIVLFIFIYYTRFLIKINSDDYSRCFLYLTNNQFRIIITDILVSYFLFQKLNIFIFDKIKKITKEKYLWIRNNASTIISQVLTAILFYEFSFYNIYAQNKIWQIILTGLIIKIIVSLMETPFLYISKRVTKNK